MDIKNMVWWVLPSVFWSTICFLVLCIVPFASLIWVDSYTEHNLELSHAALVLFGGFAAYILIGFQYLDNKYEQTSLGLLASSIQLIRKLPYILMFFGVLALAGVGLITIISAIVWLTMWVLWFFFSASGNIAALAVIIELLLIIFFIVPRYQRRFMVCLAPILRRYGNGFTENCDKAFSESINFREMYNLYWKTSLVVTILYFSIGLLLFFLVYLMVSVKAPELLSYQFHEDSLELGLLLLLYAIALPTIQATLFVYYKKAVEKAELRENE